MKSIWRVLWPALMISIAGSFHFGYQLSVMNTSEESFQNFINYSYYSHYGIFISDAQWSYFWPLLVNMQTIGGLLGTCVLKRILEKWSRKKSFYLTNTLFICSCFLQGISKVANAWEVLTLGRLLCGVAQGVQQGLQPVYFNEISPKSKAGLIGSATGFTLEFGFLLASILGLPIFLGDENRWPYLFLVEAVPSLVTLVVLPFFHDSPKFLATQDDYGAAGKALLFFGRSDVEVIEELQEIREELEQDFKNAMSLKTLFTTPHIRKGVLLGWVVIISSLYSGIVALSFFSTEILQTAGVAPEDALYGTIGITGLCFVGALLGAMILDRFGRRPITLVANGAMLLWNVMLVIFGNLTRVYSLTWAADGSIAAASMISLTYGLGLTSIMWLMPVEMVPQSARPMAQVLAMTMQWVTTCSAAMIFYPLQKAVNEYSFLSDVGPLTVSIFLLWWALPETKNRAIAEIMQKLGYEDKDTDGNLIEKF